MSCGATILDFARLRQLWTRSDGRVCILHVVDVGKVCVSAWFCVSLEQLVLSFLPFLHLLFSVLSYPKTKASDLNSELRLFIKPVAEKPKETTVLATEIRWLTLVSVLPHT